MVGCSRSRLCSLFFLGGGNPRKILRWHVRKGHKGQGPSAKGSWQSTQNRVPRAPWPVRRFRNGQKLSLIVLGRLASPKVKRIALAFQLGSGSLVKASPRTSVEKRKAVKTSSAPLEGGPGATLTPSA